MAAERRAGVTDVPDHFAIVDPAESLRWRCRCGKFGIFVTSAPPGLSLRHTCPHCGDSIEWLSSGEWP